MAIIEVSNLTKKYESFTAVDNISFNVEKGEIFGILGPNGAGKTTILEMIETLRTPSAGKIFLDNLDVVKNAMHVKKIIGVQLQSSTYFDRLTLAEIINLFASIYQNKVSAKKLLADVGLEQKINCFVEKLSGGQKQRFSIATTLVNNPKVVFLDEPTTGLDPQARRNVWKLIKQIHAHKQTIVITTHYMEEAEILCDRIAIMDQGKIIDLDSPKNLIKKHGTGSIINFKSTKKIANNILRALSSVNKIKIANHFYELISKNETKTLKDLLKIEEKFDVFDISIRPSTLEDVFLNLTGKKLRE